jgi:hypothetical protein
MVLMTVFSLVAVAAITYRAVLDNYESIQLQVYDAVIDEFKNNSITDITVHVSGREVTLLGDVTDDATRDRILKRVQNIKVVDRVVNRILTNRDYQNSGSPES